MHHCSRFFVVVGAGERPAGGEMLCLPCLFAEKTMPFGCAGRDIKNTWTTINATSRQNAIRDVRAWPLRWIWTCKKIYSLREIIRDKIQREGPLTFRDFMEISLYHPHCLAIIVRRGRGLAKKAIFIPAPIYRSSSVTCWPSSSRRCGRRWGGAVHGHRVWSRVRVTLPGYPLCGSEKIAELYKKLNYFIIERE